MTSTMTREDLAIGVVNVDGMMDANGIRYFGRATRQPDGTWQCIADCGGILARVEIRLKVLDAAE